ncbi:MAG TPA: hydrogenase maturation protease [Vicinamibacterales bacterium]|jgi:hydrogenase maturation protease
MPLAARARTLVAGLGNIFLGDDGFGVEVVRRLGDASLGQGIEVADIGIRGVHLAYELLAGSYDRLILVDALPHGSAPGTVSVIEPDLDEDGAAGAMDGHALHPAAVLALVRRLGGRLPEVLVVGCEPESLDEGMGLSPVVAAAVEPAMAAVRRLVHLETEDTQHVPGDTGTDCRTIS